MISFFDEMFNCFADSALEEGVTSALKEVSSDKKVSPAIFTLSIVRFCGFSLDK